MPLRPEATRSRRNWKFVGRPARQGTRTPAAASRQTDPWGEWHVFYAAAVRRRIRIVTFLWVIVVVLAVLLVVAYLFE